MWTHRRSGQQHQRSAQDHREPYERDRTRVIHCPAFRRLQRKTQILGPDTGDFHRTRLTHSLEVASIACSIVRNLHHTPAATMPLTGLLPNEDLISTISLLHDIGHPPFGHSGEVALNYMMRFHGGFESNGQTLRLLTQLEDSYGAYGLDLTRRSLLGILKYPVNRNHVIAPLQPQSPPLQSTSIRMNDWLPPKAYFDSEQPCVDWLLSPFSPNDQILFQSLQVLPHAHQHGRSAYHSFDCSIMNTADDIAYGVHDLEDAIHLQLITQEQVDNPEFRALLRDAELDSPQHTLLQHLFSADIHLRKQAIGTMVNYLITSVHIIVTHDALQDNLLKHNITLLPEAKNLLTYLKNTVYRYVIDSPSARTVEKSSQTIVLNLFESILSNPDNFLDTKYRAIFNAAENESVAQRVVCDYIANMTDESALRMNNKLFGVEVC
jgi:dGTPase